MSLRVHEPSSVVAHPLIQRLWWPYRHRQCQRFLANPLGIFWWHLVSVLDGRALSRSCKRSSSPLWRPGPWHHHRKDRQQMALPSTVNTTALLPLVIGKFQICFLWGFKLHLSKLGLLLHCHSLARRGSRTFVNVYRRRLLPLWSRLFGYYVLGSTL